LGWKSESAKPSESAGDQAQSPKKNGVRLLRCVQMGLLRLQGLPGAPPVLRQFEFMLVEGRACFVRKADAGP
jgi:hypothetical protein